MISSFTCWLRWEIMYRALGQIVSVFFHRIFPHKFLYFLENFTSKPFHFYPVCSVLYIYTCQRYLCIIYFIKLLNVQRSISSRSTISIHLEQKEKKCNRTWVPNRWFLCKCWKNRNKCSYYAMYRAYMNLCIYTKSVYYTKWTNIY